MDIILKEIKEHLESLPKTKDTFHTQLASLDAFASSIMYHRSHAGSYEFDYQVGVGEQTVSFSTMVKLHNALWVYDDTDKVCYPHRVKIITNEGKYQYHDVEDDPFTKVFKLSPYESRKSHSRKIVERVKIQCDKNGILHCQSNDVEFIDPLYEYEFLGEWE